MTSFRCACVLAVLCITRVAADDEATAALVEQMLPHVARYSHLTDAAAEQSTAIDEFEQAAIEDRLVNAQGHFDEGEERRTGLPRTDCVH